jgi:signal transduction histidine kinase
MNLNQTLALLLGTALIGSLPAMSTAAQAQNSDAVAAKAMLEKAVAAVKADKTKALDTFNKGEGGFYVKDRDLFPFCFTKADGKIVATQTKQAMGKDLRTFKDKSGKAFGQEIYNGAKDGQISEVTYVFGKPGAEETPVPKVSYVTGIGDLGCAVGYYK